MQHKEDKNLWFTIQAEDCLLAIASTAQEMWMVHKGNQNIRDNNVFQLLNFNANYIVSEAGRTKLVQ